MTASAERRPSSSLIRRLVLNGGTYVGARLANCALSVAMVPIYAPAGYRIVALLGAVEPLVRVLFSQGRVAAWVRLRFRCESDRERKRLESTLFWYLAGSSALGFGLVAAFGERWLSWLAPTVPFRSRVLLAIAHSAVGLTSELYLRRLQADGETSAYARFSIVRAVSVEGGYFALGPTPDPASRSSADFRKGATRSILLATGCALPTPITIDCAFSGVWRPVWTRPVR